MQNKKNNLMPVSSNTSKDVQTIIEISIHSPNWNDDARGAFRHCHRNPNAAGARAGSAGADTGPADGCTADGTAAAAHAPRHGGGDAAGKIPPVSAKGAAAAAGDGGHRPTMSGATWRTCRWKSPGWHCARSPRGGRARDRASDGGAPSEGTAYCGHCAADGTSAACPPGGHGGAACAPGRPPSASAGCASRTGP